MTYNEIKGDLFKDKNRIFAHCISSDFTLGAGIAAKFRDYGVKRELENFHDKYYWKGKGYCIMTPVDLGIVYNLVTKMNYYSKPTYDTLRESLVDLKRLMVFNNHRVLSMPKIGCGLDKLDWNVVSGMIKDIFKDTGIDITVYYLD